MAVARKGGKMIMAAVLLLFAETYPPVANSCEVRLKWKKGKEKKG